MTDIVVKKTILNYAHELIAEAFHLVLVPVVAVLKAVIAGLTYVHDELAEF